MDQIFRAQLRTAVAGGKTASIRTEHTDENRIAGTKFRQNPAHGVAVLRAAGQKLHQHPPPVGTKNAYGMVCTASRQAEALRRIDIQHSKRRRAGLDSPYPRDQRSAGRSQKPARAHLQRNAAKRFRERLHLLLDGSSARVWIRAGKAGSVTDAETAAKVERIRCNSRPYTDRPAAYQVRAILCRSHADSLPCAEVPHAPSRHRKP